MFGERRLKILEAMKILATPPKSVGGYPEFVELLKKHFGIITTEPVLANIATLTRKYPELCGGSFSLGGRGTMYHGLSWLQLGELSVPSTMKHTVEINRDVAKTSAHHLCAEIKRLAEAASDPNDRKRWLSAATLIQSAVMLMDAA